MVRLIGALLGVFLAKASYICTHGGASTSACVCLAMDNSMGNKLVASTPFQSNVVNFNFTSGDDNKHLRIPFPEYDPYFQMHGDSCVTHPYEDQGFQMQPCANVDSPGFHDDSPDWFDPIFAGPFFSIDYFDGFYHETSFVHRRSKNADDDRRTGKCLAFDARHPRPDISLLLTDCDHPSVDARYLKWSVAETPVCDYPKPPEDELV